MPWNTELSVRVTLGKVMLCNKQYSYPLTITGYRSRYLLTCDGLTSTRSDFAFTVFERAFKDFGLPAAIRTENGVPFASGNALFGLSRLAVWWLRLGINIQRIKRGRIRFGRLKVNLSNVFAGQLVGIREVEEQVWLVSFLDFDLGFFDTEKGRV